LHLLHLITPKYKAANCEIAVRELSGKEFSAFSQAILGLVTAGDPRMGTSKGVQTMSLKFKRNLPTLILLVGILFSLAVFMGDQQVTSYSFDAETLRAAIQLDLTGFQESGIDQVAFASQISDLTAAQ
jgi:hypothetical protein